jgi:hypothetical protein
VCWSQPCVLDSWEKHLEKNLPPNLLLGQITRGIGGLLLSLGLSFTFSSLSARLLHCVNTVLQCQTVNMHGDFFFFSCTPSLPKEVHGDSFSHSH